MAIIQSGASADLLTVDPTSKASRTTLYGTNGSVISQTNGANAASTDNFLVIGGKNDDNYRPFRVDRMGSQAVALNNILFSEYFEGTTISASRVVAGSTTFAPALSATVGYQFNPTSSTTASAASILYSLRQFPKFQRAPLHFKIRARAAHVTNALIELGFGAQTAQASAQTLGAYWQITTSGVVQPVLTFNGVDVTGTAVTMPSGWQSNYYTWDVIVDDDEAIYMIQDTSTGLIIAERRIQMAVTQTRLFNATHLLAYARLWNVTAPATAANLIVSSMDVVMLDAFMNKPWGHTAAHNGQSAQISPTAFTQTSNWTNSAAPTSATLSNTTAGYTTLGGLFQFAAVAGAATDYVLFGFTVPAPYSLVVTGIDIDAWNTGAAVATTPTLMVWGCGVDQSAVSLAGTVMRVPLGAQSFAVGAAIGATADRRISADFSQSPLVTNSGRFFTVILRMPVGTATASQIVQGLVTVKGYFE